MTRTWYFLRHAEKEKGDFYNPLLRHQDEPVSAAGRQEAGKLCAFCAGKPIQPVYASAYLRTAQTIEPVARQPGLAPSVDDGRLNEIDNGAIEGMSDETLRQEYPEVWNGFRTRTAGFRFPGGETGEEARGRIASLLEERRRQPEGGDFILAAQDGILRVLMRHILGLPVTRRWDFRADSCGIVELARQPDFDAWKLVRFNHPC